MTDAVATDDFSDVFANLSKLKDGENPPADLTTPPPAAPAGTEETPAVVAEETPVEETQVEEGDLPNPDAEIATAEAARAAETQQPSFEQVLDKLADRLQPKEPARPEPVRQQVEQPQAVFSPDEAKQLTTYIQEYPEIAKAEQLLRRAEYSQLVAHIYAQVEQRFAPYLSQVSEVTAKSHVSDLYQAIPDYDTVRDPVIAWVGQQKPYLQAAYNKVVENGTVDEIADLVDRWRGESGVAKPEAGKQAATSVHKETELPSAAKQAAARLAPVSSKRSQVVSEPAKSDFDGAFAAFADPKLET